MPAWDIVLYLLAIISAVWVIVEVLTKHKRWTAGRKVVWIVCALIFSIITAIVYYFVEYKKK
jgi:prolipoprotein diacylglyceryltransferase